MGPTHNRSCPDQELEAWERALLEEHDKQQTINRHRLEATIALLNLFKISDHLSVREVTDMIRKINDRPA